VGKTSIPDADRQDVTSASNGNPSQAVPEPASNQAQPIQENSRTKMFIINNYKERMQKLSGLK